MEAPSTDAAIKTIDAITSSDETNLANGGAAKLNAGSSLTASSTDEVRTLKKSEYKAAAKCLAEAFADDHVARYFIDTDDRSDWTEQQKWDLHVHILECFVYAHCLCGLATTVGPDYSGVALWMPPGTRMDSFLTMWRSGLKLLQWKLSSEGRYRLFNEFFPLLHDTKVEVLGDRDVDSYYLVYVGTKQAARGKGYARKLIEHQTKKADEEGRATYLESSNEVNPRIYRKLGFEVVKKIYLRRGPEPIELDIMVREPSVIPAANSTAAANADPEKADVYAVTVQVNGGKD